MCRNTCEEWHVQKHSFSLRLQTIISGLLLLSICIVWSWLQYCLTFIIFTSSRFEDELHPLQTLTQQTSFLKYRTSVHLKKPVLPLFHVPFFNSLKVSPHALIATQGSTSKLPSLAVSADIYSEIANVSLPILEHATDTISKLQMVANSQFQECLKHEKQIALQLETSDHPGGQQEL